MNLLKSALLHHPFPSSRRHVIRVDMRVLVDVIRVAFWTRVVINSQREYRTNTAEVKFKIVMIEIEISARIAPDPSSGAPHAQVFGARRGIRK